MPQHSEQGGEGRGVGGGGSLHASGLSGRAKAGKMNLEVCLYSLTVSGIDYCQNCQQSTEIDAF